MLSHRNYSRFNTIVNDWLVRLPPDTSEEITGLDNIYRYVYDTLDDILNRVLIGSSEDRIRFVMRVDGLDMPISLPSMKREELTVDRILEEVKRVLNSNESVKLNDNFKINIVHMKVPVASGRRKNFKNVLLRQSRLTMRSLVSVENDDHLCLTRCVVLALNFLEKSKKYLPLKGKKRFKDNPLLRYEGQKLAVEAGIDPNRPVSLIEDVEKLENHLNRDETLYRIVVHGVNHRYERLFQGNENGSRHIILLYDDEHLDWVKSPKEFFGNYCFVCCQPCGKTHNHDCKACKWNECTDETNDPMECADCLRSFKNENCYLLHKRKKNKYSTCEMYSKCSQCHKQVKKNEFHRCGHRFCQTCHKTVPYDHFCFMQTLKPLPDEKTKWDFYYYDYECTQETGVHVPNLVVVQNARGEEKVFYGEDAENFCTWLLNLAEENERPLTLVAHNMGRYDGNFILSYCLEKGVAVNPLMRGTRLLTAELGANQIRLLDSLNFLVMPLAKMPKTFGMTELKKGYFPHFFNTTKNQTYVGPIPAPTFYGYDSMIDKRRKEFLVWHAEQQRRNVKFDFKQELIDYCRSDVDILRRCCERFRDDFFELNQLDPFRSITIAQASVRVFSTHYLQPKSIGIIPPGGYRKKARQSHAAEVWLQYLMCSDPEGSIIRYARNDANGEFRIDNFRVDGYDAERKIVYEFYGCLWHGCKTCFPYGRDEPLRVTDGRSMEENYARTVHRRDALKAKGYDVVEMWECTWNAMKKNDETVRQICDAIELLPPIDERDGLFGGRTNAVQLFQETKKDEKIHYVDVTSLYPSVNLHGDYPIGHPEILTGRFDLTLRSYFGVVKCKILPPRELFHPVLPCKINNKLMFVLCRVCAELQNQTTCTHDDNQRCLTGVWYTPELHLALERGYRVITIYEVWHWKNKTKGLFEEYVKRFMKLKQEMSGWPENCETVSERRAYIVDYLQRQKIELDYDNVQQNSGKREVAKRLLNSLWGKFAQNPCFDKGEYCTSVEQFNKIVFSSRNVVKDVMFFNEYVCYVVYEEAHPDFITPLKNANVFIGGFTTSQARVHLYRYLHELDGGIKRNNLHEARVLYFDTDSVIYKTCAGQRDLPLGTLLGELTSELDQDEYIKTFVSAGPKNYAYETNTGKQTCKIKGFTLNYSASRLLNFKSMCELITGDQSETTVYVAQQNIVCDRAHRTLTTVNRDKKYRLVYDKRVRLPDSYITIPYGF